MDRRMNGGGPVYGSGGAVPLAREASVYSSEVLP
jgi:hypothetical protein